MAVQCMSVREVLTTGVRACLQARLSAQASEELSCLEQDIGHLQLSDTRDVRTCCFEDDAHRLLSGHVYRASTVQGKGLHPPYMALYGETVPRHEWKSLDAC